MGFLVKFLSRKWLTSIVAGLILPLLGGLLPKLGEEATYSWLCGLCLNGEQIWRKLHLKILKPSLLESSSCENP